MNKYLKYQIETGNSKITKNHSPWNDGVSLTAWPGYWTANRIITNFIFRYSTGSMEPKSIVFLVDGSGSIFGESNRLLKETVKNVQYDALVFYYGFE